MKHGLPPAPTVTEKGVQTAVLYGPDGGVLKVVEPTRPPFGFQAGRAESSGDATEEST